LVTTVVVGQERSFDSVQLSAQLTYPLQKLHSFPLVMSHNESPMNL
jgi:hypothetical protein